MKISVKVKARAKEERVEMAKDNGFVVWVKDSAEKGKANKAVIKLMADYFGVTQSEVNIVSGFFSKQKILEI